MLRAIVRPMVRLVEKYMPDAFIFGAFLTVVAFVMSLMFTDSGFMKTITSWGNGFYILWTFVGQGTFNLIVMVAMAATPPVRRAIRALAGTVKSEAAAYGLVTLVATICSLLSWAGGLFVGAMFAKETAVSMRNKGVKVHYPLIVASAYTGFVVWHMGLSGSSPLFVATKGHAMEKLMGVLPVSQTIMAPYNVIAALVLLITLPVLMILLRPQPDQIKELPTNIGTDEESDVQMTGEITLADKIERQRWITLYLGIGLAIFLVHHFISKGFDMNLNILGTLWLAIGLLMARSPFHYLRDAATTGKAAVAIVLYFPFYAGIMGIMMKTGLVKVIAGWFIAISTAKTLAFWTFISAGLVNLAVPSGGGQWAVQGPVMIEAAKQLGTDPSLIVMAVAYGDQWTNMIQPFWAIPLLGIAGLGVRDIMGYTFMTLIWTLIVFGGVLLLVA